MTWHGEEKRHSDVQTSRNLAPVLRQPMRQVNTTDIFKTDVARHLIQLRKNNPDDTTIPEFRRWLKEDLMSFDQKSANEQVEEKLDYERDIGNDSATFQNISAFLTKWVKENISEPDSNIWYHGTTEEKYTKIIADGEIKVSTADTIQHKEFSHDIGTISLAKYKGMAHFFSALSGKGSHDQIILHIDTSKFDPAAIKKRTLIQTPNGELLYHKNIPISSIIKVEKVYTANKEQETPDWRKYLVEQKPEKAKLNFSKEVVNPTIEMLEIDYVLDHAIINYSPVEYPEEQPYIDNRLIPYMKTTKLSLPVIEFYNKPMSNHRPERPRDTNIHVIDGNHRIVAMKKLGFQRIPFVVYKER